MMTKTFWKRFSLQNDFKVSSMNKLNSAYLDLLKLNDIYIYNIFLSAVNKFEY